MIIQSWDDSMNLSSPAPKDEASDEEKDKASIDTNATPIFTAVGHLLIKSCAERTGSEPAVELGALEGVISAGEFPPPAVVVEWWFPAPPGVTVGVFKADLGKNCS
jgi:hypothetical protein